jgi:hypothetical protein
MGMGTRFFVGAVHEAMEEVIIGADARSLVRIKASQQGQQRVGAGEFDPIGNARDLMVNHEQERAKQGGGISMRLVDFRGV